MIIRENIDVNINRADKVADILRSILLAEDQVDQDKEHFWTIGLDGQMMIKYIELVSLGVLTFTPVQPRETFRLAIMKGVASIIIGHNHPCNNPNPSDQDIKITKMLKDSGEILGIKLQDHVIITKDGYISFLEQGIL